MYSPCKPGIVGLESVFSSLSDIKTLNRGPKTIFQDKLLTRNAVPNVLCPRVFRPELSDIICTIIERDYRNDPMFSDTWVWANSADPDKTAPKWAV